MRKWAAILLALAAAGLWAWRVFPHRAPSESALRRTAGIAVEALGLRPAPRGVEVRCRVTNSTSRVAAQIVLRVEVLAPDGRLLGVNPLAGVPELAASTAREEAFLVPVPSAPAGARARAEISLVRWRD